MAYTEFAGNMQALTVAYHTVRPYTVRLDVARATRATPVPQRAAENPFRSSETKVAGSYTAGNAYAFFSHRGERGKTGRFGAVIGLGG